MKGKLNELWALLGAVNAAKERARNGTGEWAVVDEDGLAQLTQVRGRCFIIFGIPTCSFTFCLRFYLNSSRVCLI